MTKARKTINVDEIADKLQVALLRSETVAEKKAFAFAVESILMDSGNYKGFGYVDLAAAQSVDFDDDDVRTWNRLYFGRLGGGVDSSMTRARRIVAEAAAEEVVKRYRAEQAEAGAQ